MSNYNSATIHPVPVNITTKIFQIHIIYSILFVVNLHCPLAYGDDTVEMFKAVMGTN